MDSTFNPNMKQVSVLGSTGSIGQSTLSVVRHLKEDVRVAALAAHSNINLLQRQIEEFSPECVAVFDEKQAACLKDRLPHTRVLGGMEGVCEVAAYQEADFVVSSIVGMAGLLPTIAAIEAGKDVGLANKEVLVAAGALVSALAKKHHVRLLPIDSEHNAIFQCLQGEDAQSISRVLLTASGGPFRDHSLKQLKAVTVEEALNHPTWKMGPKVTVDSSTLMNKGLEMIEAHWLFGVDPKQIEVLVHRQSIVHSMVEFADGSIKAQLNEPNMMNPIQYALTYPVRMKGAFQPFDFSKNSSWTFEVPDEKKFSCLKLAYFAIQEGGSMPCYMNAANEVLVERFLNKEIRWCEIGEKLDHLMQRHCLCNDLSLDEVLAVDRKARQEAIKA